MHTLLTILLGIFVFGVMVFIHELGHFIFAKLFHVKVTEFSIGMGPAVAKWGKGETRYCLRCLPFGGYVAMVGEDGEEEPTEESTPEDEARYFYCKPVWQRLIILLAGASMNVLLGFILLLGVSAGQSAIASRTVSYFDEAATSNGEGGLMLGDEIIRLNGSKVNIGNDISYGLIRDEDGYVDFTVLRNGEQVQLTQVPFQMTEYEDGTTAILLDFKVQPLEKNALTVLREGFYWTISIVKLVWGSLIDLITGQFGLNQISGPVGVVSAIGEAASISISSLLIIIGMITINIGVFNLLPFPALDGGRVLFLLIEWIFRKPIPQKVEGIVNLVGLGLLLLLMIVVTVKDVINLF